jgi:hypothetical protein
MSFFGSLEHDISDIGQDIGNFFKNPIDDIALGAGVLTGGLLLPEALGAFGVGAAADVAGGALGGAAAGGAEGALASAPLDLGAAAGGGALSFAGDAAATGGDVSSFLASPTGGSALPATAGTDLTAGLNTAATAPFQTVGDVTNVGGADLTGSSLQLLDNGSGVAGGAAPGGAAAPGGSGVFQTGANFLKTAAPYAGVAGLAANLYSGYEQSQQLKALQGQEAQNAATVALDAKQATAAAGPAMTQGEALQSYLSTGTLPQNIQAQVDQQVAAAKAQITQGYASRGMSTDPNQNSALAQDLANVDTQAQSLKGNLETQMNTAGTQMVQTANSLIQTGVNATNISAQIPIMMQNLNLQLAQATSAAISSFAAALNGGTKVTLAPTTA